MKHFIIHRRCIDIDLEENDISDAQRTAYLRAQRVITDLVTQNRADVVLCDSGAPGDLLPTFSAGEKVILYGAYREICVRGAFDSLQDRGCDVDYHPVGCVRVFPDDIGDLFPPS